MKAFQRPTFDVALAGAKAVDEARALGRPVGPLAGVPIGLKDLYYTKGIPTTASSKVLEDFVPDFDATVWTRLHDAGMVLLGKMSTTEFAYGPNSPPTVNPWDTKRSPGGSSGGSGAALAARMLPAALGTDTGCSVVNPSAMCGVSASRARTAAAPPRCGLAGLVLRPRRADGPPHGRLRSAARRHGRPRPRRPGQPPRAGAAYPTTSPGSLAGVRVGLPDHFFWDDIEADTERVCREGVARLAAMGAEIVDVPSPPSTDEVLGTGKNPYGSLILQGSMSSSRSSSPRPRATTAGSSPTGATSTRPRCWP